MARNKKYKVTVEKIMWYTGSVEVTAPNPDAAEAKVKKMIDSHDLEMDTVTWNEGSFEEGTFRTTGDVD